VETTAAPTTTPSARQFSFAALAPVIFVLLWSTGFIASKYGLPYAEPFTYLSIRFLLAGVLLLGIAIATRARWPSRPIDAIHIGISGVLLHGVYLSGVFHAIHLGLPAGLASLIVNLQPVLTSIFAQILLKERVVARQWIGLGLGLAGVGLVIGEKLFLSNAAQGGFPAIALLPAFIGLFGTALGTIYQKRYSAHMNIATGTIIQYIGGGIITGAGMFLFESRVVDWNSHFIFAMSWQVLVLSIGAIWLLMYLIRQNSASRLSSLFYLVPPLTALEAFVLFNERLGVVALAGMVLVVIGVVLVVRQVKPSAAKH
jgi:drug/metabolite transporter (DMT)-like permease